MMLAKKIKVHLFLSIDLDKTNSVVTPTAGYDFRDYTRIKWSGWGYFLFENLT
jgi:outer membrane protein assembly factor BamA